MVAACLSPRWEEKQSLQPILRAKSSTPVRSTPIPSARRRRGASTKSSPSDSSAIPRPPASSAALLIGRTRSTGRHDARRAAASAKARASSSTRLLKPGAAPAHPRLPRLRATPHAPRWAHLRLNACSSRASVAIRGGSVVCEPRAHRRRHDTALTRATAGLFAGTPLNGNMSRPASSSPVSFTRRTPSSTPSTELAEFQAAARARLLPSAPSTSRRCRGLSSNSVCRAFELGKCCPTVDFPRLSPAPYRPTKSVEGGFWLGTRGSAHHLSARRRHYLVLHGGRWSRIAARREGENPLAPPGNVWAACPSSRLRSTRQFSRNALPTAPLPYRIANPPPMAAPTQAAAELLQRAAHANSTSGRIGSTAFGWPPTGTARPMEPVSFPRIPRPSVRTDNPGHLGCECRCRFSCRHPGHRREFHRSPTTGPEAVAREAFAEPLRARAGTRSRSTSATSPTHLRAMAPLPTAPSGPHRARRTLRHHRRWRTVRTGNWPAGGSLGRALASRMAALSIHDPDACMARYPALEHCPSLFPSSSSAACWIKGPMALEVACCAERRQIRTGDNRGHLAPLAGRPLRTWAPCAVFRHEGHHSAHHPQNATFRLGSVAQP